MNPFDFLKQSPSKEFYQRLGKLNADFGEIAAQAEAKNQRLQQHLQGLGSRVATTVSKHNQKSQKTILAEMLSAQINAAQTTVSLFIQQVDAHQHNTKFRDEFNDSVLVFIYGKVKAGKSSLGNFVGQHPEQKTTPKFFKYDKAGQRTAQAKLEELAEDGFETKVTEATDTIQGFKINGLTWIDTPGLHSLTDVNGDLARRYVEAADLILYITSSDSPARASDTAEIMDLVGTKNKKVCVILSKSDCVEEDEVDGELVQLRIGKSESNRQLQENHVKAELCKALGDQAKLIDHIHSCSTLLGYDGIKGNAEAWQQSNMDKIYQLLTQEAIINAKKLKENIPAQRFNGLLNAVVGESKRNPTEDLQKLIGGLKELAEKANAEREKLKNASSGVYTRIRPKIAPLVREHTEKFFTQYGADAAKVKQHAAQLNQTLGDAIKPIVVSELSQTIHQSIQSFDDALPLNFQLSKMPEFKEKFKEIQVKSNNVGTGALIGGALAMLFTGGLAAIAIGAAIGAAAGADETSSKQKIKEGDNRDEVREQIIQQYEQNLPKQINQQLSQVADEYFGVIADIAQELHQHVKSFIGEAHGLRF
jgi:tRNA U34 5-carboxymethylaminomethyl modifying GTPase MnmE/TrmE